ncbi:6-phosphogluconolactonase [Jimgerdemannia flammicorona]|uniref:6-phosphogluconolactonase n=1 Tax=Jimgerdemannia flammicorona TaxID=994334 RepID=A0A433QGF9_9FUNG|nr:6-phosphogluconolactonase [Jimgerdemannia flammicorona]
MPEYNVYIGTYTNEVSKGIYLFSFDSTTGTLTPKGLAAETVSPSFLALHPLRQFLYAVNESSGTITSFSIDAKTGLLTELNQRPTNGSSPCYIIVDPQGRHTLTANYGGGSVVVHPILADGRLGVATSHQQHAGAVHVVPDRQEAAHAHSINLDPSHRFAIVLDLGADKAFVYRFNAVAGALSPEPTAHLAFHPGSGPRHLAFHPSNPRVAYAITELSKEVVVLDFDPESGKLKEVQRISALPALPEGYKGQAIAAEIQVHPSGLFVYGSLRGHDSIVVYSVNTQSGMLTYVRNEYIGGKTPRNFSIDPTGRWLIAASQDSGYLVVFEIDQKTGELRNTGNKVEVSTPVCVRFVV